MASVFLSYRQESEPHRERVRELALRLRAAGISVVVDALKNEEEWDHGGPSEGWLHLSYQQVEVNDKVLIIGSSSYYAVYEGKALSGIGVGAAVEARRIFQIISDAKGINHRFRVVSLAPSDEVGIPDHIKDYHRFKPNERGNDFDDMVQWLRGSSAATNSTGSRAVSTTPGTAVDPPVPPVALEILQGAIEGRGLINLCRLDGGISIVAGVRQFDCQSNPERAALLEYAMKILVRMGWIEQEDDELYHVKHEGYEASRQIFGGPNP